MRTRAQIIKEMRALIDELEQMEVKPFRFQMGHRYRYTGKCIEDDWVEEMGFVLHTPSILCIVATEDGATFREDPIRQNWCWDEWSHPERWEELY